MPSERRRKPNGMQASEWQAPVEMVNIAKDRTVDIVGVWSARFRWGSATIQQLAESCYMQGINDCVDSLTREGVLQRLNPKPEPRNLPA